MEGVPALAAATALLVLLPGPNVALIVANTLQYGRPHGLATVLGTTIGVALQLALVVAGFSALISRTAAALSWIRWLGVIYLLYLGISAWRDAGRDPATPQTVHAWPLAFRGGLMLAVVNPKTLLFAAAFLPQFVWQPDAAASQLPLLAAVYLLVVLAGDCIWVLCASAVKGLFHRHAVAGQRLVALFLVGAGAALAVTRERP